MKTTIAYLAFLLTLCSAKELPVKAAVLPPSTSRVFNVYCQANTPGNFAKRGQIITICVTNLDDFLTCAAVTNNLPKGIVASTDNMVPFINDIPMVGSTYLGSLLDPNGTEELQFKLDRDATDSTSKKNWKRLFNAVWLSGKSQVSVSVGFPEGWYMETDVGPWKGGRTFSFVALPVVWASIGFLIVLLLLCYFLKEAANTDIIRDPYLSRRPDGSAAFSLARVQMAFWFFLVFASYFLLWAMTGDKDTIPPSILVLMGISAGTALGSALVDVGKANEEGRGQYFLKPKPDQTTGQLVEELVATKQSQEQKLMKILKDLEGLSGTQLVDRENKKKEQQKIEQDIHRTDVQLAFYRAKPYQRFVSDILSDQGVINFHRYQMAGWTLVLGFIFGIEVCREIAMPVISDTLLALMGISGGTYIGFKIPSAKS
jgi:hypothetical protein